MKPAFVLFGVPLDNLTMGAAVDRLGELVEDGRAHRRHHQVSTVNVDFLVNALDDPEVRGVLQRNALNLADGAPLVWASRWLGTPLPERVAGADLVPELAKASVERQWTIHLFGGADDVAARARNLLVERFPGARITAQTGPRIGPDGLVDVGVIDSIKASDADILCVALGNPKQERFIAENGAALGCPVQIGIGGSLDLLLGVRRRAPRWIQRIGAEWLFRAAQEPGRLGPRYLHDLRVFVPRLATYAATVRRYRNRGDVVVEFENGTMVAGIRPTGSGGRDERRIDELRIDDTSYDRLKLDLGSAGPVNPGAHGLLVQLVRASRIAGTDVCHGTLSPAIRRALGDYGTLSLFE